MWVLTGVGSRQVVPGVGLFDDVLVDLVPLALSVTPEKKKKKTPTTQKKNQLYRLPT